MKDILTFRVLFDQYQRQKELDRQELMSSASSRYSSRRPSKTSTHLLNSSRRGSNQPTEKRASVMNNPNLLDPGHVEHIKKSKSEYLTEINAEEQSEIEVHALESESNSDSAKNSSSEDRNHNKDHQIEETLVRQPKKNFESNDSIDKIETREEPLLRKKTTVRDLLDRERMMPENKITQQEKYLVSQPKISFNLNESPANIKCQISPKSSERSDEFSFNQRKYTQYGENVASMMKKQKKGEMSHKVTHRAGNRVTLNSEVDRGILSKSTDYLS